MPTAPTHVSTSPVPPNSEASATHIYNAIRGRCATKRCAGEITGAIPSQRCQAPSPLSPLPRGERGKEFQRQATPSQEAVAFESSPLAPCGRGVGGEGCPA